MFEVPFLFFPLVEISYADRLRNRHPNDMTGKYFLVYSVDLAGPYPDQITPGAHS